MANTREVMGEQACLDALVADTLTSFEDDTITKVGPSGLKSKLTLTNVTLSNCKSVGYQGLQYASNLEVVDILGTGLIDAAAFYGCTKLKHLLLRGSTKTTLDVTSAFTNTPIAMGNGAIYVPSELLATYKADNNWKNYIILPIDRYPASSFDTITESWAELDAMTQAQIEAKYAIGDTKLIDLGTEGKVYAQIAGFGLDDLTSGGKAKVTFIAKSMLKTNKRMNPSNSSGTQGTGGNGGWEYSEMRTYLNGTVLALLPSELRSAIKSVTKYSDYIVPGESAVTHDQVTQDKLWLLSAREVFGGTSYEQTGSVYSSLFSSSAARIRRNQSGSAYLWWLRSASSVYYFRYVDGGGNASDNGANSTYGVVLGFCI